MKAKRRKTTGTGRMRHLDIVRRSLLFICFRLDPRVTVWITCVQLVLVAS